jgi:hypothetical protein
MAMRKMIARLLLNRTVRWIIVRGFGVLIALLVADGIVYLSSTFLHRGHFWRDFWPRQIGTVVSFMAAMAFGEWRLRVEANRKLESERAKGLSSG